MFFCPLSSKKRLDASLEVEIRRAKLLCLIEEKISDKKLGFRENPKGKGQEQKGKEQKKTRLWETLAWPKGLLCRLVTYLLCNLLCKSPYTLPLQPPNSSGLSNRFKSMISFYWGAVELSQLSPGTFQNSQDGIRNFMVSSGSFLCRNLEYGNPHTYLRTSFWIKTEPQIEQAQLAVSTIPATTSGCWENWKLGKGSLCGTELFWRILKLSPYCSLKWSCQHSVLEARTQNDVLCSAS